MSNSPPSPLKIDPESPIPQNPTISDMYTHSDKQIVGKWERKNEYNTSIFQSTSNPRNNINLVQSAIINHELTEEKIGGHAFAGEREDEEILGETQTEGKGNDKPLEIYNQVDTGDHQIHLPENQNKDLLLEFLDTFHKCGIDTLTNPYELGLEKLAGFEGESQHQVKVRCISSGDFNSSVGLPSGNECQSYGEGSPLGSIGHFLGFHFTKNPSSLASNEGKNMNIVGERDANFGVDLRREIYEEDEEEAEHIGQIEQIEHKEHIEDIEDIENIEDIEDIENIENIENMERTKEFKRPEYRRVEDIDSQGEGILYPAPRRGIKRGSPHGIHYSGNKVRSARGIVGLRTLSVRVREVVFQRRSTTYKEVADQLIHELIFQGKITPRKTIEQTNKEEKNVRRRVYDALNVLIATGVFKKVGKLVSFDGKTKFKLEKSVPNKNDLDNETHQLSTLLDIHQNKIHEKKEYFKEIMMKTIAIQNLVNRNEKLDNEKWRNNKVDLEEIIQFPFIIIATPDIPDNGIAIRVNREKTQFNLCFKKEVSLLGDIDALLQLKMHEMKTKSPLHKYANSQFGKFLT